MAPCGGPSARAGTGGWGASGLAALLVLSCKNANRHVPRRLSSRVGGILPSFSSVLTKPDHHRPRPTTRTRRLYHLVIDGMDVRVVGCPRQDHQRYDDWLGGRFGNNPHLSHSAWRQALSVTGLSLAGRWWSGLRPDAPLCAAPFPPPLGAARLRNPACGGIIVFRYRGRHHRAPQRHLAVGGDMADEKNRRKTDVACAIMVYGKTGALSTSPVGRAWRATRR